LGDRKCYVVELNGARKVSFKLTVATTRDAFTKHFERERIRIVLEVGTHSRWISSLLRDLGHDVLVIDPRRIPRNASEDKSDWKDAEHLGRVAQAMPELLYPVQHRSDEAHADLSVIKAREALVAVRTKLINTIRGMVKSTGERLPSGDAAYFATKVAGAIPVRLAPACAPLVRQIAATNAEIKCLDKEIKRLAKAKYPETAILQQVTGIAELTSLAFVLTIGDPHRFTKSRDVGSYLGLRPRLHKSCSIDPQLPITKQGNAMMRRLLVLAAHCLLRKNCKTDNALRRWGLVYCERGGKNAKKRAVVAVARKLAVLLHRMWITGEVWEPLRNTPDQTTAA